ncbi:hypothetical protein MKX03_026751 [Papaver bracteatum]|nr:hypothetical protein MKX03_026751 [Papaver bracteatum]
MVLNVSIILLVDHDNHDDHTSQLRFHHLWESSYCHNSLLVFSTGRTLEAYKRLKKRAPMLTPDVIITSVGTEIAYGESMVPYIACEQFLNQNWDRAIFMEETHKFPQLIYKSRQRRYKLSFNVDKEKAEGVKKALLECLAKRGVGIKIIFSGGHSLDVLPKRGGKGQAALLFTVPDVYGVMVCISNIYFLPKYNPCVKTVENCRVSILCHLHHTENTMNNPKIIHATERCASGIIQAIGHFKLGTKLSPRDVVMEFPKKKFSNRNPRHKIVEFYLFYEQCVSLKSTRFNYLLIQNPSGVFVHPSGQELLLHDSIDELPKFYGYKQRKKFRIWVDRVSYAQIGLDTWSVKFDKLTHHFLFRHVFLDEGPKGCNCTVVLCTMDSASNGFVWMHMHQTWLTGFGATEQNKSWLFQIKTLIVLHC